MTSLQHISLTYSSHKLSIDIASECTKLSESALNSSRSFSKAEKMKYINSSTYPSNSIHELCDDT